MSCSTIVPNYSSYRTKILFQCQHQLASIQYFNTNKYHDHADSESIAKQDVGTKDTLLRAHLHNKKLAPPGEQLIKQFKGIGRENIACKKGTKARGAQMSLPGEVSTSHLLRRSSRRQQSAQSSESSWYIPDDVTVK